MNRIKLIQPGLYSFHCPGCKETHNIWTSDYRHEGPKWGFNGNLENPTFTPSLLIRSGHYAPHYRPGDDCWCTYNAEQRSKGEEETSFCCSICHSFITDGRIQFLSDCTHHLAGHTVDIPDVESH